MYSFIVFLKIQDRYYLIKLKLKPRGAAFFGGIFALKELIYKNYAQQALNISGIIPYQPNKYLTSCLLLYNPYVFRKVAFALYHFFFPIHRLENNLRHKPAVYLRQSDDQRKGRLFLHHLKSFFPSF